MISPKNMCTYGLEFSAFSFVVFLLADDSIHVYIFFALFWSWCAVPCIFWRCRKNQNEISCLCNALNQPRKCWKPFLLMPIVWSYLCLLYSPHTRNSRMCRFMTHKMWTVHCHSKCPIFFFWFFIGFENLA